MSYTNRRGRSASQWLLEDLVTLPTETDETFGTETLGDSDLSLFTNTQFFDFDSGRNTDFQPAPVKVAATTAGDQASTSPAQDVHSETSMSSNLPLGFISEFHFSEFSPVGYNPLTSYPENTSSIPTLTPGAATYNLALPAHQQLPPQLPTTNHVYAPPTASTAPVVGAVTSSAGTGPQTSDKRKTTRGLDRPLTAEEQSRMAAEEDKRRKNTEASARFRIKKKMREQALERSAKELSEKVTELLSRISQLETENKWLRNMVLEKNGAMSAPLAAPPPVVNDTSMGDDNNSKLGVGERKQHDVSS